MADEGFKERLEKIKAKWEEGTANPESMTVEAKRQCLEELDKVCKSLGSMRDGLAKASEADRESEEKIKAQKAVDSYKTRLMEIHLEMQSMGVYTHNSHLIYGFIHSNWLDRAEYLEKIETLKHQINVLECCLKDWKPALNQRKHCFDQIGLLNQSGQFNRSMVILPPPTDYLRFVRSNVLNDNCYTQCVTEKINKFTHEIYQKRSELHNLLMNYKPVDMKAIRGKLVLLNKEKEDIIYNLRVLECQGHFTGFDVMEFVLK